MNTSHGTPRARAACASACAWLPALPVTTPAAQRSPSVLTLFAAPRTLNEPVRWRFSALSPTSTPSSWVWGAAGSTGVGRTSSPIRARAGVPSSAVTLIG